jgi:hypothetical protein
VATSEQAPRRERAVTRTSVVLAAIAVALGVSVYAMTLHDPFVYDDFTEVVDNASIRDLTNLEAIVRHNITRPVTNLSNAIDYAVWELNPVGYHLTNILLHALNIVLCFVFVRTLTIDRRSRPESTTWMPFAVATMFAVHPMLTEAVTYIAGRSELLVSALILSSLLAFRRAFTAGGAGALTLGIVFFVLALGTKETAIMLPLVLLAYDRLILSATDATLFRRRLRRVHVPLIGTMVALGLARAVLYVFIEQRAGAGFRVQNLLIDVDVLGRLVSLLIIPLKQSFIHGVDRITAIYQWPMIRGVAILGLLGWCAVRMRRKEPLVTFGIGWTIAWLLPGVALILLANSGQPLAERRAYLASCGVFIAAGVLLDRWAEGRAGRDRLVATKVAAIVAVVVAVLMGLTVVRNQLWADPVLLWSDAVEQAPGTWLAQFGLAGAYESVGDCESALPPYRRAIALVPENLQAYEGLAACLAELNRRDEARDVLRSAIRAVPDAQRPRVSLANLEVQAGRYTEASRLCAEVQALDPHTRDAATCGRQ